METVRASVHSKEIHTRNLRVTAVGDLGIAVFTADAPTDDEWKQMLDVVRKADLTKFRGISFSDGGAPNSAQRKAMHECTKGISVPSVVVTSNAFARGVVTAMSWFNPSIKAFAPEQIDDALRHLKVSDSEFGVIKLEVRKLANLLGKPLACIPKTL
jgi:hypothetical protein